MDRWTIAAVQMDCRLGDRGRNLTAIRGRLREAAGRGAQLVIFPECALTGYSFESKDEAWPHVETIPGPATEAVAADCCDLGVWACFGLLERTADCPELFNACALVGPEGPAISYRKIHLPYLGVDRFASRGDRPFAVLRFALRAGRVTAIEILADRDRLARLGLAPTIGTAIS